MEVTHVRSNWHNIFEAKTSKVKVTGAEILKSVFGAYLREKCIDSCKT